VIVQVGDRRFLDLSPRDVEPEVELNTWFAYHLVQAHSFLRVKTTEAGLELRFCDLDKLKGLLEEHPDAVAHRRGGEDNPDDKLLFTADSASLQNFVRDHLDDDTFFNEAGLTHVEEVPSEPADVSEE
jgi:hypothetical protein